MPPRKAPTYIRLASDLSDIERHERAARIAERFAELNDDPEEDRIPLAAWLLLFAAFVVALGIGYLVTGGITHLNAASIEAVL
jgi:hypothetical protein